jgi:hypothetical protein
METAMCQRDHETPPLAVLNAVLQPDGTYPNGGWINQMPSRGDDGLWLFVINLPQPGAHPWPLLVFLDDAGTSKAWWVAERWDQLDKPVPFSKAAEGFANQQPPFPEVNYGQLKGE